VTQLEMKNDKKRVFTTFVMPMILLAIRIETEVIFKNCYPSFMSNEDNEKLMSRLINGAITEILDPNIYFSRFSFLESGKEAIDLKHKLGKKALTSNGNSLPNVKNKYYTRSSLVKNLVPFPSEGKVRAMFSEGISVSLPKILKPRMNTSRSPDKNLISTDS
jgi:hypothetical protein